jgi:glutamate N-acetyltransferase/amino-acid N-acetyltransferase
MAVNFPLPTPFKLKPVPGIQLGYAEAGIKKPNRKDLLVMKLAPTATVAGVFTTSRCLSTSSLQVCRKRLPTSPRTTGSVLRNRS